MKFQRKCKSSLQCANIREDARISKKNNIVTRRPSTPRGYTRNREKRMRLPEKE